MTEWLCFAQHIGDVRTVAKRPAAHRGRGERRGIHSRDHVCLQRLRGLAKEPVAMDRRGLLVAKTQARDRVAFRATCDLQVDLESIGEKLFDLKRHAAEEYVV